MNPIIKVENLSKQYRIGARQARYATLRESIVGTVRAPFKRLSRNGKSSDNTIWALKDVSFDVMPGETVGIVGSNGAGKSTLLKIMSRITDPTTGGIDLYGRVGSLLEVGTGFHPELTGRENIYLSGAILGMRKSEIDRKFDEIVAFAEVEEFIDRPMKHYSSGMYIRLAFAVAAHLESEILVIDEVLSVGDVRFQKRCLGKMSDVARNGRTVLFVSHNMGAVRALCSKGIYIKQGQLVCRSDIETIISTYLSEDKSSSSIIEWNDRDAPRSPEFCFRRAYILNDAGKCVESLDIRKEFSIVVEYEVSRPIKGLRIGFAMQTLEGISICGSNDPEGWPQFDRGPGTFTSRCTFPGYTLNTGTYLVNFTADEPPYHVPLIRTPFCLHFNVEDTIGHGPMKERLPGVLRPNLTWAVANIDTNKPSGRNLSNNVAQKSS